MPPLSSQIQVATKLTFLSPHRTILAVQMGAMMAGQISAMTPDYLKAKVAAGRLFKLFDRVPVIQSDSDEGLQPVS